MNKPLVFINPYSEKDYKTFEKIYKSTINKNSKGYEITLEQLESMKLSPFMEKALFGRTSKEWRELTNK